jgi:predicted anti-sigma-YlaC factor YlaD
MLPYTRRCRRIRRLFSLVLDREASPAQGRLVAAHLARCADCRAFAYRVSASTRAIRAQAVKAEVRTPA